MSFASHARDAYNWGWRPPTTMVDVMFLILAFFVTIAAFHDTDKQVQVSLPASESGKTEAVSHLQVVVTVTSDGAIYMGDQPYTLETLRGTLAELAGKHVPVESMIIRGDRDSRLDVTVQVMDVARAAGVQSVFLGTVPQTARKS